MTKTEWTSATQSDLSDMGHYIGARQNRPMSAEKLLREHNNKCNEYADDGQQLATAAGLGMLLGFEGFHLPTIHVWSTDSGEEVCKWDDPKTYIPSLSFLEDGSTLSIVERARVISEWETGSDKIKRSFTLSGHERDSIASAVFSLDRRLLVTSGLYGSRSFFGT